MQGCSHIRVCTVHVHAVEECANVQTCACCMRVSMHVHELQVCKRACVARACNCAGTGMHVLQVCKSARMHVHVLQACMCCMCKCAAMKHACTESVCKWLQARASSCKHMQMHACIASLYCTPVLQLHTCKHLCECVCSLCLQAFVCICLQTQTRVRVCARSCSTCMCTHIRLHTRVHRQELPPQRLPPRAGLRPDLPALPGGRLHRENEN